MIKVVGRVLLSAALLLFLSGVSMSQTAKPEQPVKPEPPKSEQMKPDHPKVEAGKVEHPQQGQMKPDHPQQGQEKPDHPKHEHPK